MDELTIGDKTYISSKKAAQITGYAKDYVGQLCREGHVEAKMVGRNWYVLESSIRAHRFGNETKNDQPTAPEGQVSGANPLRDTWEAPKYEPVTAPGIVPIAPRPVIAEEMHVSAPQIQPVATAERAEDSLTDMQAAWKEWFARKQEATLESPQVIEAREAIEELSEVSEVVNDDPKEEEFLPAPSYEAESEPEEEEEAVPVPFHTIREEEPAEAYTASEEEAEPVRITRTHREEPVYASREPERAVSRTSEPKKEEEVIYVREYRSDKRVKTRASKRPRVQQEGSYLLVRTGLIAIMLLAVSVAVLGTGLGDAYSTKTGAQYAAIKFFNGSVVYEANI